MALVTFRRFVFTGSESVLKVTGSTENFGKLCAATQTSLRRKRPTSLTAAGEVAINNAVKAVITANEYENNPRPFPEKIYGPITVNEDHKKLFLSAFRERKNGPSDKNDLSMGVTLRDERTKLLAKEGWILFGERETPEGEMKMLQDFSVFDKPGTSYLFFKRPVTMVEKPSNPLHFAFSPDMLEGDAGFRGVTLRLSCIKDKPPLPDKETEILLPSEDVPKAAFAMRCRWRDLKDPTKKGPYNRVAMNTVGMKSVTRAVKILALALDENNMRTDETGFVVYPSFYKTDNGLHGVVFQPVSNQDILKRE